MSSATLTLLKQLTEPLQPSRWILTIAADIVTSALLLYVVGYLFAASWPFWNEMLEILQHPDSVTVDAIHRRINASFPALALGILATLLARLVVPPLRNGIRSLTRNAVVDNVRYPSTQRVLEHLSQANAIYLVGTVPQELERALEQATRRGAKVRAIVPEAHAVPLPPGGYVRAAEALPGYLIVDEMSLYVSPMLSGKSRSGWRHALADERLLDVYKQRIEERFSRQQA